MATLLATAPAPAAASDYNHHLKTALEQNGSKQLFKVQAWLQEKAGERVPLPEVVRFLLEHVLLDPASMAQLHEQLLQGQE
jgi:hypothetical protein